MIGSCNCPITGVRLQVSDYSQLSDYSFADQLEQNTAVYAPITFQEIVIVMIRDRIWRHDVPLPINHNHYNFYYNSHF